MMKPLIPSFIAVAAASLAMAGTVPVMAQAVDGTQSATSTPSTKAERKAAREEARAKKNAEMKKLEDAGYNPATANMSDYPQNLQKAQAKAAATSPKAVGQ
jgi:hypothetical protein